MEDHSLSAVYIYLQPPSISGDRSSIRNLRTRHAVVTGTSLSGEKKWNNNKNIEAIDKALKVPISNAPE